MIYWLSGAVDCPRTKLHVRVGVRRPWRFFCKINTKLLFRIVPQWNFCFHCISRSPSLTYAWCMYPVSLCINCNYCLLFAVKLMRSCLRVSAFSINKIETYWDAENHLNTTTQKKFGYYEFGSCLTTSATCKQSPQQHRSIWKCESALQETL